MAMILLELGGAQGGAHDGVYSLLVVMMKKRRLLSIEEPA